ncbi:MAG: FapA family protein, partial [Spirochaetota bacterium]
VKKGEVLGHLVPASAGRAGCDLQGRELVPSRSHKENWAAGAKVLIEDGELRAEVDGLLVRANFQLSVEEVFLVKAGVDYHTGHILFPGDVIIEGKVADGFKVWSGGSILCKTTLDAFDINAKKDLVCQQGIIGRKNGQVKVGGNIAAKFIENCRVACRGDIQVLSAIMGAKVFSLGIIDLGEKGVIMGGETWAVHGLKAARLGNQARQRTLVHVGIDFTVQQRLDQANLRLRQLAFRAQQIDAHVSTHPEVDGAALHRQVDKLVEETRASINDLLVKLDGDDAAIVEVRGEIWPGTIIDICRVEISVDQLLKGCRFRLDKVAGRILVERLAGSEGEKKAAKGAPPAAAKGAPAPANEKAPGKTPASPQTKATSPPAAAVKK